MRDYLKIWESEEAIQERRERYRVEKEKLLAQRPMGVDWAYCWPSFVKGWDEAFHYLESLDTGKELPDKSDIND